METIPSPRLGFLSGVFLANHLASTDNLTRTTNRQNTQLTVHKSGPNRQHTSTGKPYWENSKTETGLVAFYAMVKSGFVKLGVTWRSQVGANPILILPLSLPVPPLHSLSFPSLLPFPFPSLSSLPLPPSPWRGGRGSSPGKFWNSRLL